jgi:hypothetical protein
VGGYLVFGAAYALTDSYEFLQNGTALGRNLLVLFPAAVAWAAVALFGRPEGAEDGNAARGPTGTGAAQRVKRSPSAAS